MKSNYSLLVLTGALLFVANSAKAASIYDNNKSALNINMLTDVFMSYTGYGEKTSDLFAHPIMYGTMDRFDEYGDDGSTLTTFTPKTKSDTFINNIWINANHVNENLHYNHLFSERGRFNLATVGATTRNFDLTKGNISFGGFISYINTKLDSTHANGDTVGLFSQYKYRNFGAKALLNTGSLNNSVDNTKFNNSWLNLGASAYTIIKLDDTFFVRPDVYLSYTFVTSSDLYVNNHAVHSGNYNFFNVAPSVSFIKEVSPDWYGSLSAKYVGHAGGRNAIDMDGVIIDGLYLNSHTDIGLDVEYDYEQFVFGAKLHKQIGGIDGWSTNLNAKYAF